MSKNLDRDAVTEALSLMYVRGDVHDLFNEIEQEGNLKYSNLARTKVFISYSRKDKKWLEKVKIFLKPLTREHNLEIWADTEIESGGLWKENIENAIESSKVAVLLVTANFMASDFIAELELPKILTTAETGEITVLPIIISPYSFTENNRLNCFQTVNDPANPIVGLSKLERDKIFLKLSQDIKKRLILN